MTLEGYGGLVFYNNSNMYHWYSQSKSGNIVDFVQEWYGVDFISAIERILNIRANSQTDYTYKPPLPTPKKELVLPPRDDNIKQIFAYLVKTRGLEPSIVSALISQKKIYQSRVEKDGRIYRNCAFVGVDKDNNPKHCSLRSPNSNLKFHQDVSGSDKSYSFSMQGRSNRLYVFESAIDAISHASLTKLYGFDWTTDHRVSEGGLDHKSLDRYLKDYSIREIVLCYDNDFDSFHPDGKPWNKGQDQAIAMAEHYEKEGYLTAIQVPQNKDFNEDLLEKRAELQRGEHGNHGQAEQIAER